MIEVKHLTKHYGSKIALSDVSFTVQAGEILGFLGPNGAGKSTAMNIITGYLSATRGSVTVDGHDILEEPMQAKKKIGYLPEQPPLYPEMTVREYLNFVYNLKGCKLPRQSHIDEICKIIKITGVYNRVIRNLSKGYKQRVGIAQALIGNPEVLILDEPTVGLDPQQIIEIRNLIKKLGNRHTVILSSHILPEVQAVCDRVVVIANGRIVADDTPDHLSRNMAEFSRFALRIEGDPAAVKPMLETVEHVKAVTQLRNCGGQVNEYRIEVEKTDDDIRRPLALAIANGGFLMLGMESSELSLEDVFLKLTKDGDNKIQDKKALKKSEKLRKKLNTALDASEETDQPSEETEASEEAASEPDTPDEPSDEQPVLVLPTEADEPEETPEQTDTPDGGAL